MFFATLSASNICTILHCWYVFFAAWPWAWFFANPQGSWCSMFLCKWERLACRFQAFPGLDVPSSNYLKWFGMIWDDSENVCAMLFERYRKIASICLNDSIASLDCSSWIKDVFSWDFAWYTVQTSTLQPFLLSVHSFYSAGGLKAEQINAECIKMQHRLFFAPKKGLVTIEIYRELEARGFVQRSGARWTYWHWPRRVARSSIWKVDRCGAAVAFLDGLVGDGNAFRGTNGSPWCHFRCNGVPSSIHPHRNSICDFDWFC